MLASTTISVSDKRVIVFITRVSEVRVPLLHGHVFAADVELTARLQAEVVSRLSLDNLSDSGEERCAYYSPASDFMGKAELITHDAYYLGYVRVPKKEGAKVVRNAVDTNSKVRSAMESLRLTQRRRRIGRW